MTAELVLVPRGLIELVIREDVDEVLVDQLRTVLASPAETVFPPWEKVRLMAEHLGRMVDERGLMAVSELDQLRATMRDDLDALEVSLHDEWALYHGLVWVGMVTELARNGYKNGKVSADVLDAVKEIATTIASALLEFLPPEAKKTP